MITMKNTNALQLNENPQAVVDALVNSVGRTRAHEAAEEDLKAARDAREAFRQERIALLQDLERTGRALTRDELGEQTRRGTAIEDRCSLAHAAVRPLRAAHAKRVCALLQPAARQAAAELVAELIPRLDRAAIFPPWATACANPFCNTGTNGDE